jgi:hypothetical protein
MPQILHSIRIADIGNGFPRLLDFVCVGVHVYQVDHFNSSVQRQQTAPNFVYATCCQVGTVVGFATQDVDNMNRYSAQRCDGKAWFNLQQSINTPHWVNDIDDTADGADDTFGL